MILADKIIEERKKLGLSQEELAEKLSVSRQAVSKWESAQSIPDLQKIILMSELFSVSTDYLLKDEMEPERKGSCEYDVISTVRRVSMEEANVFMKTEAEQSKTVAFGVLLCILSPVLLIFLSGLSGANIAGITETVAVVIGLLQLFLFIAIAVFLFIFYAGKTERFDYLKKEPFETAYGVSGLVKEKKKAYGTVYIKYLSCGVGLCILSPVPLIFAALISDADALVVSMAALLLCIVAIGVFMIVRVALINESYEILLQEGDFCKTEKQKSKAAESAVDAVSSIYWCLATGGYLAWSFISNDWKFTWIVWPVAGVLFVPIITVVKHLCGKDDK
ncbi:MAG: helix-turn-helix transcriptional regulator [Clostridia bacterium]|nr:helix-turn-helix transcriptional regulator [Clostridia bacterium]